MKYVKFFKEIKITDVDIVGGKNASLGQMFGDMAGLGIRVPDGFAITAQAYWYFLEHNGFNSKLKSLLSELRDYSDLKNLRIVSGSVRKLIESGHVPKDLEEEIFSAYKELLGNKEKNGENYSQGHECQANGLCKVSQAHKSYNRGVKGLGFDQGEFAVALRSSATAEDSPGASFAGQQETFLNVVRQDDIIKYFKKCLSSLFTERAIVYRAQKGFDHFKVALSVCVQKMIRSDLASSGVIFTLDPECGFDGVVTINSAYGLGEIVVQGAVIPDEFVVHKETLQKGFEPIVKKVLGKKEQKIVYSGFGTRASGLFGFLASCKAIFFGVLKKFGFFKNTELIKKVKTTLKEQESFSLNNNEILELSKYAIAIEKYYSKINGRLTPMDIEWAKDGVDGKLYILQARPETVHAVYPGKEGAGTGGANKARVGMQVYKFIEKISSQELKKRLILTGQGIGRKIASGKVRVIDSAKDISQVCPGDILVTKMTDPDWVPAMKKAKAIITDKGGRTCHAAIVSRELSVPAIVGTINGSEILKTGQDVTVDCSQGQTGYIYSGLIDFEVKNIDFEQNKFTQCPIMFNIANPDSAFSAALLPNDGVGLARIEFIISNAIQIHPMAFIKPEIIQDKFVLKKIEEITKGYSDKKEFFVDNLAYGIGTIAAAFYPKPVIVRFSDFKTNEYRNLIGGKYFEPEEENPMIGWRGASRYYNENYCDAFALECKAIRKCRDVMGLKNIKVMIPFVRTIKEAELVIAQLEKNGLKKENGLENKFLENKSNGLEIIGLEKVGSEKMDGESNGLEIIMMCEIPSNVILIEEFAKIFDGFSIGSNDLTQLTLGVDRDSGFLGNLFNEADPAVKKIMAQAICGAKKSGKHIGVCGQAPSDLPEVAKFLIESGVNYLSINPDSLGQFLKQF